MSGEMGNKADVPVSLEELFLSREFGQVNVPSPSTPRLSPFGPGHASTTHGRLIRSRALGTMSAAAAVALVVAIGLSGVRLTPSHSSGITSALSASPSNGPLDRGGATGGLPATTGSGTAGAPLTGAVGTLATGAATQVAAVTGIGGARPARSGGTGTGTPPAAQPTPTPPSQNPVAPVVTLIDTTVSTVTSTATGVTTVSATTSTPPKPPKTSHSGPVAAAVGPAAPSHTAHVAAPTSAHTAVHLVAAGAGTKHAASRGPT